MNRAHCTRIRRRKRDKTKTTFKRAPAEMRQALWACRMTICARKNVSRVSLRKVSSFFRHMFKMHFEDVNCKRFHFHSVDTSDILFNLFGMSLHMKHLLFNFALCSNNCSPFCEKGKGLANERYTKHLEFAPFPRGTVESSQDNLAKYWPS